MRNCRTNKTEAEIRKDLDLPKPPDCEKCGAPSDHEVRAVCARSDKGKWKRIFERQKKEIEMAYQGMDLEIESTRGLLLTALDSEDLGGAKARIRAALKGLIPHADRGKNPLPF